MKQGELFDAAHHRARNTDPETSHEAATQVSGFAHEHARAILAALAAAGRPLAAEEIGDRIGLDHVAVNRRLSELERDAAVRRTTERHRNRSGREAFRYTLTPIGREPQGRP